MAKAFIHDQNSGGTDNKNANAEVTVNSLSDATVTAISEQSLYSQTTDGSGRTIFTGLHQGSWEVSANKGRQTASRHIDIITDYETTMRIFAATINITYPSGSICKITDGKTTLTAPNDDGIWVCTVSNAGTWTVTCTDGIQTKSYPIEITDWDQVVDLQVIYFAATINVTYPYGSICSCSNGSVVYSASDTFGTWTFVVPFTGTWTITAENDIHKVSKTVTVLGDGQVDNVSIKFFGSTINITYPVGAECICTDGNNSYKAPDTSGEWSLVVPRAGIWLVRASSSNNYASQNVEITADEQTVNVTLEFFVAYINVTYPSGAFKVVLLSIDSYGTKTQIGIDASGSGTAKFTVIQAGNYEVAAYRVSPYVGIESVSGDYSSKTTSISSSGQTASVSLAFNAIPAFTYGGSCKIVDDSGNTISSTTGNWNIRFLTTGVLKFTELNGAREGVDVFVLGGGGNGGHSIIDSGTQQAGMLFASGGGGGGGGYRETAFNAKVSANTNYTITIGGAGGTSSGFGVSASGGGNGGNAANANAMDGVGQGGTGGSNGGNGAATGAAPGKGVDGSYAFYGNTGSRYGPGGGGGYGYNYYNGSGGAASGGADGGGSSASNATTNSGGGGGGGSQSASKTYSPGSGGSGIVIIRNKR